MKGLNFDARSERLVNATKNPVINNFVPGRN